MGSLVAEAPRYNDCSPLSASQDEDDSPDERSPRLLDQEASGGHHQVSGVGFSLRGARGPSPGFAGCLK